MSQLTKGYYGALYVSIALLTSCASIKTAPSVEQASVSQSQKQTKMEQSSMSEGTTTATSFEVPASFELSGAIATKHHQKGWTASIHWQQSGPNQYQIRLVGPLGGQTVIISRQQSVITYQEGAKKIKSTNGDDLLQKQTGIHLPVNNLYYWVRGIKAPGAIQSATYNEAHRLQVLKQAGYTIEYTQYTTVDQMLLPSKIRLQGHEITIKLVIQQWK